MTQTERNYAHIEKECLSIVFAAERFEQFILRKENVKFLTDHKPLETLFKKATLKSLKRMQRMRLRLQKYSMDLGAISLKLLEGKLAPKLVYFVLRKELLNL